MIGYSLIAGISTVVSLLSTLCRGSPSITHNLLRSDLLDSIECALQGNERSALVCRQYSTVTVATVWLPWRLYGYPGDYPSVNPPPPLRLFIALKLCPTCQIRFICKYEFSCFVLKFGISI